MQDRQNGNLGKTVIFELPLFLVIFWTFSMSEYCKYSRASRNIVRFTTGTTNFIKACGSPADRCRDFLAVNN
jgi:hypothetical protein